MMTYSVLQEKYESYEMIHTGWTPFEMQLFVQ